MIKVAIIDDHLLFSQSLAAILQANYADITITMISDQPENLFSLPEQELPEVILLDVHLNTSLGYGFVEVISKKIPNARVILLSGNMTVYTIQKGLEAGVFGFLSKDTSHEEVWDAIQMVHNECQYVGKSVQKLFTQAIMNRESQLSHREIEIIKYLCKGLTHKEIGDNLFISHRTVEAHRNNILSKLNMESVAELVSFAVKNGII
jgi:two-component system, NarL family, nitrate/nitrite response regulator NarL